MNNASRYKIAFFAALAVVVALAGWLVLDWRNAHREKIGVAAESPTSGALPSASLSANATDVPLSPVQLTPERMQSIGVKLGTAEIQNVSDAVRASGNVEVDERRIASVQTRFPGWIRNVYADASYQFVRKGEPLFTIYSPDLVTTEQEYLLAKKNAEAVQSSTVSGVSAGSQSLLAATRQRLEQWEVPASEIQKLESTGKVITDLTMNSPVTGYITEKNALPNMYVQPETHLYTISDLSDIWVLAQVFQNDAGKIKPGDHADVTVDAYPGKVFSGRVDYLLPQVDMATRTLPVRLVIPNPGLKLRPGMYVNVRLKLPLGRQSVVPASAIFHSGTRNLIFAYQGEGNIQPREVEVGARVGDDVVITKGVHAGDQIIASANFLIDSEAQLQAAAGAFVPPPPGAGQAAAMNVPLTQASVELSTQPTPLQKGTNTIRVKLSDSTGRPIAGAQVSVTFFMAA